MANIDNCAANSTQTSVELTVMWRNAPAAENIIVQLENPALSETIDLVANPNPPYVVQFSNITLTSLEDVVATAFFETTATCSDSIKKNIPLSCIQPHNIAIEKTIDTTQAVIGDEVTYTIIITNEGQTDVTNVTVTDALPIGLTYSGTHTASVGTFDGTTWAIGNMASNASPATLSITATIATEGIHTNTATVSIDEVESTLTDNIDQVCVSTPISLPCGENGYLEITGAAGYASYQWYKDSLEIVGAIDQIYNITEVGTYNYTVDGGALGDDCIAQMCCPLIVVEPTDCVDCVPNRCIPILIEKNN